MSCLENLVFARFCAQLRHYSHEKLDDTITAWQPFELDSIEWLDVNALDFKIVLESFAPRNVKMPIRFVIINAFLCSVNMLTTS